MADTEARYTGLAELKGEGQIARFDPNAPPRAEGEPVWNHKEQYCLEFSIPADNGCEAIEGSVMSVDWRGNPVEEKVLSLGVPDDCEQGLALSKAQAEELLRQLPAAIAAMG